MMTPPGRKLPRLPADVIARNLARAPAVPQAHSRMTPHAALRVLDKRFADSADDEVRAALDRLWSLVLRGD
jgi:hypothetical protein